MLRTCVVLVATGLAACHAVHGQDQISGKTVEQLIQNLDAESFNDREAAQKALVELGKPAVEHLQSALAKNPSIEVRQRAVVALKQLERTAIEAKRVRSRTAEAPAVIACKTTVDSR